MTSTNEGLVPLGDYPINVQENVEDVLEFISMLCKACGEPVTSSCKETSGTLTVYLEFEIRDRELAQQPGTWLPYQMGSAFPRVRMLFIGEFKCAITSNDWKRS